MSDTWTAGSFDLGTSGESLDDFTPHELFCLGSEFGRIWEAAQSGEPVEMQIHKRNVDRCGRALQWHGYEVHIEVAVVKYQMRCDQIGRTSFRINPGAWAVIKGFRDERSERKDNFPVTHPRGENDANS